MSGFDRLRHWCRRYVGRRCSGFLTVTAAKQTLQQPRPARLGWRFQLTQGLALQATEFAQQQRHFPCLTDAAVQLLGEFLQRLRDFARQWQSLQLGDQRGERGADLIDARFTALLGVEHGFFQTRQQGGEAGVHVIGTHDFAHFFHALIDSLVGAFGRQRAAHQTASQQVESRGPAAFELVLLFDALEVLLFPALGVVAHSQVPRGAGLNAGNASAVSEPGRRISTATGR